jgi:DNA-binding transcriptional LysR family regulator
MYKTLKRTFFNYGLGQGSGIQENKWTKKKTISLDELLEESFILRKPGSGTQKIIDDTLKASGLEDINSLKSAACLSSSTAVKEGIKSGMGVSIISSRALETEIKSGILKTIKIKGITSIKRSFYLIKDKRRIASPLCEAMIKFLKASGME